MIYLLLLAMLSMVTLKPPPTFNQNQITNIFNQTNYASKDFNFAFSNYSNPSSLYNIT